MWAARKSTMFYHQVGLDICEYARRYQYTPTYITREKKLENKQIDATEWKCLSFKIEERNRRLLCSTAPPPTPPQIIALKVS